MKQQHPAIPNSLTTPYVAIHHRQAVTTSLNVACVFGKDHAKVLKSIRALDVPAQFAQANFGLCSYLDLNSRSRPMVEITRDGFTLLAMGFTGRRAMQFKIAYIETFNQMQQALAAAPQQVQALKRELSKTLLAQKPEWKKIKRYKDMQLNHIEIARLLKHGKDHIRREVRKMEACGLLEPPANLARLRQGALRLAGGIG